MKQKLSKSFFALLLVCSVSVTSVSAESISELENKSTEIENNINNSKEQIDEKQANLDKVNEDIRKLDTELEQSVNELNNINSQLDEVTNQLNEANDRLVEAKLEKDSQQETLEKRVRYMYEYGEVSYLNTLFGSESFTDFLNRVEYLNRISEYDHTLYAKLEAQELEINDLVETIDSSKTEIEVLQKSAQQKRDELQANVDQKQALNAKLNADIDTLNAQLAAQEQASKDVENMIQAEIKRQQELAAQNGGGSNTVYTGGTLMWPSDTTYISDHYGYRIHPITGENKLHAGMDIGAPMGSPVYAAESGTVLSSGWISGYGNAVVIMHDNGLQTLTGHMSSLNVSAGQRVNRGDVVGYCGSTGNSTGPHVHFEVRVNGETVDPIGYF